MAQGMAGDREWREGRHDCKPIRSIVTNIALMSSPPVQLAPYATPQTPCAEQPFAKSPSSSPFTLFAPKPKLLRPPKRAGVPLHPTPLSPPKFDSGRTHEVAGSRHKRDAPTPRRAPSTRKSAIKARITLRIQYAKGGFLNECTSANAAIETMVRFKASRAIGDNACTPRRSSEEGNTAVVSNNGALPVSPHSVALAAPPGSLSPLTYRALYEWPPARLSATQIQWPRIMSPATQRAYAASLGVGE